MRIGRADHRHVEAAWHLLDRCRRALDAQGMLQWDDVYPTVDTIVDDVGRGVLFVLESEDGGLLGAVTLDDRQSPEYAALPWASGEPALVVHRLCVDPECQGRGYARRLMEFAESYAAQNGYASVRLDAYTANQRSVDLYRRRGYREVGQVRFPRRPLPFWCFELTIDQPRSTSRNA